MRVSEEQRYIVYWFDMAEASKAAAPNAELLEWAKKDKRRMLHVVYRVGDLERTIKYVVKLIQ